MEKVLKFIILAIMSLIPVISNICKKSNPSGEIPNIPEDTGYEIDMTDIPRVYFENHKDWEKLYNTAWNTHKNNIKSITYPLNPELTNEHQLSYYVDEAFDERIFRWDTTFMMLFDKYGLHQFPTLNSLDNFYIHQHITLNKKTNGFISRMIYENDGSDYYKDTADVDAINPPLYAWAEWEQYQIHGDVSRFTKEIDGIAIIDRIDLYYQFIRNNRRITTGKMKGLYISNGQANGLDNTPNQAWDKAWTQAANDLSIQQVQAAEYISKIANEIVEKNKNISKADKLKYTLLAEKYDNERAELTALIRKKLWSDENSFFFNANAASGELTNIATPTGLWALVANVATEEQARKMIENYALNSEKMFRPNGLSTVTYDYETFKSYGGYWNGAVWSPTSYQWIKGLQQYGYDDLAFQEAVRHVNTLSDVYKNGVADENGNITHSIWENYSSEYDSTGYYERNHKTPSRTEFVGWTGALAIGSVIEDIIGVTINSPENTVNWNIHLTESHGISNLYMNNADNGENRVSLKVNSRNSEYDCAQITVTSTKPFVLNVSCATGSESIYVDAGTSTYTIGEKSTSSSVCGLGMAIYDFNDFSVNKSQIDTADDYVLFSDKENDTVNDGLKNQINKSKSIFNVNTIGFRYDSKESPAILQDSLQLQDMGFENAKEYVKSSYSEGSEGFMFMAKADTEIKTIYAVLGVKNASAELEASISDASSPNVVETLSAGNEEKVYVVKIPYCASSDNKNILFKYRLLPVPNDEVGNISLKAIWIESGGVFLSASPTNVKIEASDKSVSLSAERPQDIEFDKYLVCYGENPYTMDKAVEITKFPLKINNLNNHARYYFTVYGIKDGVKSQRSEILSAVPEEGGLTDTDRAYIDYNSCIGEILNGNIDFDNIVTGLDFTVTGKIYESKITFDSESAVGECGIKSDGSISRPIGNDMKTDVKISITCKNTLLTIKQTMTVKCISEKEAPIIYIEENNDTFGKIDLTNSALTDWIYYSSSDFDKCLSKQSNPSLLKVETMGTEIETVGDGPFSFSFNNKIKQATCGICVRGLENGYRITLGYSEHSQTVKIYSAVWAGTVTVTCHSGAIQYDMGTLSKNTDSGLSGRCFEIKYKLLNPADTVTIDIICTDNSDNKYGGCCNVLQAITAEKCNEELKPKIYLG